MMLTATQLLFLKHEVEIHILFYLTTKIETQQCKYAKMGLKRVKMG